MPAVVRVAGCDELGERADLGRGAVVDDRPVEPGQQDVRGAEAGAVDAVDLLGRQLGDLVEVLVRDEARRARSARSLAARPSSQARSACEKSGPAR